MLEMDRRQLTGLKMRKQLNPLAPAEVMAVPPEQVDPLPAILEKITEAINRLPIELPEPAPVDNTDICNALAEIKKTLAVIPAKRKYEFKFNRDQHDFITSIEVTEL